MNGRRTASIFNFIEHLWLHFEEGVYHLTKAVKKRGKNNKKRLLAATAIAAFTRIPFIKLDKVIKFMKHQYTDNIMAGGGHTKY